MKLALSVDIGDGPVIVETSLFITVLWERKYKKKASDLANGIGVEDLAYMAHEAMKAQKIVVPAMFDDFIKKIVNLEVVGSETTNPTPEVPTAAA